ncbi:hypothetical protein BN77_p240003 [Rhizobium mesoamericanum STM3625]|uniref:Uncharacterized protein n=1 Tax=Rhizobium mesoamericanum STM3625 TaxID=1211777 RepID=K0Q4W4_9HYPH|nr:hypothetical protein BN77_p240003 [Rhizobium mesoamericanum STM3625]
MVYALVLRYGCWPYREPLLLSRGDQMAQKPVKMNFTQSLQSNIAQGGRLPSKYNGRVESHARVNKLMWISETPSAQHRG